MFKLSKKVDFVILGVSAFAVIFAIGYGVWAVTNHSTVPAAAASEMSLSTLFQESGAEMVQLSAQCWEQIDNNFHGGEDMALYYEGIREVLGDDDLLSFDEYDDQGYAGFSISGITEQGYTLNLVVQSLGDRNTEDETYIIVELADKSGSGDIENIRSYLNDIFSAVSCRCDPSFMVEGKFDELLSKREKKRISKNIFALMEGKIEEKVSDGSYVSFSGYTEHLPGGVQTDDHTINLQTALSDNEEEGSTHIYIGTPVVFSDF